MATSEAEIPIRVLDMKEFQEQAEIMVGAVRVAASYIKNLRAGVERLERTLAKLKLAFADLMAEYHEKDNVGHIVELDPPYRCERCDFVGVKEVERYVNQHSQDNG